MARALSVMRYLVVVHKLDEDHLMPVGAGARRALAKTKTAGDKEKSRRVEFILSYEEPGQE